MADPIDVKAPDGSIVRFPAGTSDDTINGAMAKEFGGGKPAPAAPTEQPSTLQTIRDAIHAPTRALENGTMLGLGDRARALINSVPEAIGGKGWNYSDNLKKEQGETAQFATAHPIAAPVLEGVGGVAAPAAVIGAIGKGASLGTKTLIGMGTGGTIGGVQGALGSKDWTDLPQVAKDTAVGTIVGAGVGGVIPGASKVVGAGYNAVANAVTGRVEGMSRAAGGHLIRGVEADGPAAVQQRLAELGPDAMLLDGGPALLGKAQGASLNSDEGRSVLQTNLTARDKGTNARVRSDLDGALGPYQGGDPQTVTDNILAHRSAVDAVNYPAALNNAPPIKIAPIMTDLIDRIDQTPVGSMEHKALTNLQGMLTKTQKQPLLDAQGIQQYDHLGNERWRDVHSSHDDANVLHKVKGELDNVIEHDLPGLGVPAGALNGQQAALKQVRHSLNNALETQIPDDAYKTANAMSSMLAKRAEAVKLGTQYLGSGKTTPSPDRFAAAFDPIEHGAKIALAKGSRGEIERIVGTKANDLQAMRGELQGEGGWNAAKLATVHGQAPIDDLVNSVDRNLAFRDRYNKVVEGSQTDMRNAARKEMKPDPSSDTPFLGPGSTLTGMGVTAAKKGVQGVVNALTRSDPTRSYGEVARALSEQGPARDARLAAVVDAINSRRGNEVAAPVAGNIGAVVAAILGKSSADELRGGPTRRQQ
jgi:hypothetical protein